MSQVEGKGASPALKGILIFLSLPLYGIPLLIGWLVSLSVNSKEEAVQATWADVEVLIQRRLALVNRLIGLVQDYASHERDSFSKVAQARATLGSSTDDLDTKVTAAKSLDASFIKLLAVSEDYPELKADAQYAQVIGEISSTEDQLALARKEYNDRVRAYNLSIRQPPGSWIAWWSGLTPHLYYQEQEREGMADQHSIRSEPVEVSAEIEPSTSEVAGRSGAASPTAIETLKQLKEMLNAGLVTESDYEKKKSEILAQM